MNTHQLLKNPGTAIFVVLIVVILLLVTIGPLWFKNLIRKKNTAVKNPNSQEMDNKDSFS